MSDTLLTQNSQREGQPATSTQGQSLPGSDNAGNDNNQSFAQAPQISLPKGGGAIKGIDEKFSVNAVNGTASLSIPFPVSDGRGLSPSLQINYNSGAGNGIFGMGWTLGMASIKRKTEQELPQYLDAIDSDTYILSDAEDLVPEYQKDDEGNFITDDNGDYVLNEYADELDGVDYLVKRYRPRIEGVFARIERWTETGTGYIHWRVISSNNITTLYGKTAAARVADPANDTRIFEWLSEFTYDDKGRCLIYEYKQEDGAGMNAMLLHNKNRLNGNAPFTNTYLKRAWYGNATPYTNQGEVFPATNTFYFETVLDYGEDDNAGTWPFREDAFSVYRAGFEIRTARLCRRVLLYHHFDELPGGSALIRSLDFLYGNNGQDGFNFLQEALDTGYTKQEDGSYTQKSLPPLSFEYQEHSWNTDIKSLDPEFATGLPEGIDDSKYLFVDLYSEGLAGILTEQGGGWFYKSNLGNGRFTNPVPVMPKPSFNGLSSQLQLLELEADGVKQVVNWKGSPQGFFELKDGAEWQPFMPFESIPNISLNGPNTRLVDLNGDGLADVLITENEVLTWYPSKGKKGYDASKRVVTSYDEEKGPAVVFADVTQSIFLADMSGDGLQDLVRIRNGNVCYWPNLGYGHFGAKVSMDFSPVFDIHDQFSAANIKLADIDGSGTTDILYFGADVCSIWLNQHGNAFLPTPKQITSFPAYNDLSSVNVIDLLGNGLACIVYSSSLPNSQLRYIDLMDSRKPHIITGYKNNVGKEITLEYQPSTKYYIEDKLAGNPWATKLHFPVHCVSKAVTWDRITKTRFASEYSYHHGYYDHFEKEFRGFGRVDQKDSEDIAHFVLQGGNNATVEEDLQQPPVLTKTWYHTGAFTDRQTILNQFSHEYFQNNLAPENNLPEPELPVHFSIQECREALRACKGKLLRSEVYALDASADEDKPYVVEQHNCAIKLLQPLGRNKNAVLLIHESEGISYHYERNPADPRVSHSFIFEVDDYGNVLQSANVAYPRRTNPLPSVEQMQLHITFNESVFTNAVQQNRDYRAPASHFTRSYAVTGIDAPADYFTWDNLRNDCNNAAVIDYEVTPNGSLQKRLLAFARMQYRGDDGTTVLPFGTLESKGLMHQTFKALFNDAILNTVFGAKIALPALTTALINGGYVQADNYFWIPSGTTNYEVANFYLSTIYTDIFGHVTNVQYDARSLFVQQVTNAVNNTVAVEQFNYRVMTPYVMRDANDNLSAVRFDELGMVTGIFNIGKPGIDAGDAFDDTRTEPQGANDFPGAVMEYSLHEWYDQTQTPGFDIDDYKPTPNFARTRLRVTHYHADPLHQTQWQESYTYSGGSGNIILKKAQAEPGPALQVNEDGTVTLIPETTRWIGNGRTILNNKGNAVKQYEPYFSVSPAFDDEEDMVQLGVTSIMHYDPLNRAIRTDLPNKTFKRVEFTPWQKNSFDPNDTVRDSEWYIDLGSPDPLGPEPVNADERAAWLAAKHHDTPIMEHLDSLGRAFLNIATDGAVTIETRNVQDIEGNLLQVIDGLGRVVVNTTYGMVKNKLSFTTMDGGSRWNINNAAGKLLLNYDDRNHTFTTDYDEMQRPVAMYVEENGITTMFQRMEYGESLPVADAKAANLLTNTYRTYDQAGIMTSQQLDFKGNLVRNRFQLAANYQNTIDWTVIPAVELETDIFEGSSHFDGLSRLVRAIAPHNVGAPTSEIWPSYNEAGLLDKVDVFIRGAVTATPFVTNINYNAKAQREEIFYGNGTKTSYTYDTNTFSLIRLLTTRNNGADILQDLHYTFDPAGNITEIRDDAQADVFFDGEMAQALNKYEYDALYRLVRAGGRKHAGQTDVNHTGVNFRNHPFINSGIIDPNDGQAFRNYTEQFQYDQASNMLSQQHTSKNSGWTRTFEYANGNNQLTATTIGAETFNYTYDAHGNMYGLETVMSEVWDFLDQFREADLGGGGVAYYVYNVSGQRARKVIERLDGSRHERIYLGATELYREYNSAGDRVLERETLHVMDDKKRIAMIDTLVGNTGTQLVRYQYDNHLNSASIELDELAQLISYEEYFPFGTTSYSTVDTTREVPAKRYRYTGKERDEESGLNCHDARYYALWLCRWTKCDPIGIKAGPNFYAYVNNNPIIMNDPTGTDGETCGVWDEEAQACYAEACPIESTVDETPAPPPPAPLPPRVRYAPKKQPTPPPEPEPQATQPEENSEGNWASGVALSLDLTRYGVGYLVRPVDVNGNPLQGTYYLWSGDANKNAAKAAIASDGSGWLMSQTPQHVAAVNKFADALRTEAAKVFPGQTFTDQELFGMAGNRLFLTDDQMRGIWDGPSEDVAVRAVLGGNPVQRNLLGPPGPNTVQARVEIPAVRNTGLAVGGLSVVSGGLNIYGGTQEKDPLLAALGIGGGSVEVAGGVTFALGAARTSAPLMRLGAGATVVGTVVTAPITISHAVDDLQSGNEYRQFKGTLKAAGVVAPPAAFLAGYQEAFVEPAAATFYEAARQYIIQQTGLPPWMVY